MFDQMGLGATTVVGVAGILATTVLVVGAALVRISRKASKEEVDVEEQTCPMAKNPECKKQKRRFTLLPPLKTGAPSVESIQPLVNAAPPARKQSVFDSFSGAIRRRMTGTDEFIEDAPTDPALFIGKINFGLSYDRDSQCLSVHVIRAADLPTCDLMGSSDPYVRVWLENDPACEAKVTRVHRRNLNPVFNQTIQFNGYAAKKIEEMSLCMQVMDYDRFSRDDPIGEILLPMKTVRLEACPVYWKNLQKPTVKKEGKGEVLLSLCYQPEKSHLIVAILKGRDLPAKDLTGSSDPYVKLWMIEQGVRVEKRKTTVKTHTLSPVFNETFHFTVPQDKVAEGIQLAVTVMDYDMLSSNDEMGHVVLGVRGCETGRKHWKDMANKPGVPIGMWHKLSPKW